ncbi:MAG: ribonuclease III [Gammaproteobacteria bacterium]|nr:MAG: ribonuclease III [Gammaproteobacteria bacterium]
MLKRLEKSIGYSFCDKGLLEQALTHRSSGSKNNERLEFLGDGILNFVIAAAIYKCKPKASEGEMSRLRAHLVCKETLAEVGRELDLGDCLRLGGGELKSGGFRRDSTIADCVEAIFGAIYLDDGFAASENVILGLFDSRLNDMPDLSDLKDPKTRLQEFLQSIGKPLPEYDIVDVSGKEHEQTFKVKCSTVANEEPTIGKASSRKAAEQDAALLMLKVLQK